MRRTLRVSALAVGMAAASLMVVTPAHARPAPERAVHSCITSKGHDAAAEARGRGTGDTRAISAKEQRAIRQQTRAILDRKGISRRSAALTSAVVPVYIHKMLSKTGEGDVTQAQIDAQIAELNQDFAGQEAPSTAANTGFTFTLAGVDTYYNNYWHKDRLSSAYRKKTRLGGKNALNIWLVDFKYLGIATFPWDYAKKGNVDGIRVLYSSLPGGAATNYNEGKTASHEAGHWFGLYHTFQGGCTATNDEVSDTPAQQSSTEGCPAGRDSCSLPGLDPIHNYMDYSYDPCYNQFTPGQSARMDTMWAAYRA
ncbi:zinc metalloprotease [Nocardioides humilatus]|uniref:Zinc metalloprotease n=1 Tax=Nocardioides humilatus TaxID=2607660 RepID=A0A5B1LJA8_9ACTN|nr:zinc metalloprotease [Nocardioides humilatus]KAA1420791.1 zinc metalloprotease [Nocardioides humilatus]